MALAETRLWAETPTGAPDLAVQAARILDRCRAERPRVHAVTNAAAQVLTANLLLAAGAVPSLTIAADEIGSFTERSAALLVNLGTLDTERRAGIPIAIASARSARRPWVLDPVYVEASPGRLAMARLCLAGGPAVVRLNGSEFGALSGEPATDEALAGFARAQGTVVALTGETDRISDGERLLVLANGHPLMARTTAMGCALSALVAALLPLADDPATAAAAALLAGGIAGEVAGERAGGPGSFVPAFLDAVDGLDEAAIQARARVG
jgi:hydroxyethylthiazole kinase